MSTVSFPTARPEEEGLSPEALARLRAALNSRIENGHIPGAVAAIARNGRLVLHEAFGARDPGAGDPMPQDAIFRIYSMSKPIVSVAAMMLWEEGRFLLSDPIARFIPAFAGSKVLVAGESVAAERAITIQDLLRHTSGLTYEFRGNEAVHRAYMDAKIYRRSQTRACPQLSQMAAAARWMAARKFRAVLS